MERKKTDWLKLIVIAVVAVIGLALIADSLGVLDGGVEIGTTGGLQALISERQCEFITLSGITYVRCEDGFSGIVVQLDGAFEGVFEDL